MEAIPSNASSHARRSCHNNFPNFTTCPPSTRGSQWTRHSRVRYPINDSAKVLLAAIVGLAILLPFASTYHDGLETVAQNAGIEEHVGLWHGLMPDYSLTAIENPYFSTLASGLVGTLLVLVFTFLVGRGPSRKR